MVTQATTYPSVYTDRLVTADELAAMPAHEHYELVHAGQTVLGADLAFIRADRVPARGRKPAFNRAAPDLVYEIASGDQTRDEMADKAKLWMGRGVRLCWIQWPTRRTIDVWHPGEQAPRTLGMDNELDGEDVLPGFRCPVAAAFE